VGLLLRIGVMCVVVSLLMMRVRRLRVIRRTGVWRRVGMLLLMW
jgi:hypothetical protein